MSGARSRASAPRRRTSLEALTTSRSLPASVRRYASEREQRTAGEPPAVPGAIDEGPVTSGTSNPRDEEHAADRRGDAILGDLGVLGRVCPALERAAIGELEK